MLGVNAHVWRKIITCETPGETPGETLETSQHGKVPKLAFTFDLRTRTGVSRLKSH